MKCEKCHKGEASIHLTEIIRDTRSEIHLCESCAREIGLNAKVPGFSVSLPEMVSYVDSRKDDISPQTQGSICPWCRSGISRYHAEGTLGCPDCYRALSHELKQYIEGVSVMARHGGKNPRNWRSFREEFPEQHNDEDSLPDIEQLTTELMKALEDERYEDAALIRDRLSRRTGRMAL